jgi:hypothetical protein
MADAVPVSQPAAVASSAPVPAPASASAAPAPDTGCDLRWGFHGTVAGQEAFLRLERSRSDTALKGRYFYAKFGVDIPLEGTLDADNHVALTEGDPKKPSGYFKGTCDLATGVLSGTWTGKKPAALSFRFEQVLPRPVPLVAKKKLTITNKAKTLGPAKMAECRYRQELVELFGAGSKEAEAAINKQGAADPTRDALGFGASNECETGEEAEFTEEVTGAFRGFVTIRRGGTSYQDGAAHPNNAVGFELTTYDLATGKAVTDADLWATVPEALVKRCDAAVFGEPDGGEDFLVGMWPDGRMFNLTERGVHIYSVGYPHFASGMTGQGPTLPWAALLRDGALKADSPVKRAWEGVAKAKPGDPECFDDEGKRLP